MVIDCEFYLGTQQLWLLRVHVSSINHYGHILLNVLIQQTLPQDCFLAADFSAFLYLSPKIKCFPCKGGHELIDILTFFHLRTSLFVMNT